MNATQIITQRLGLTADQLTLLQAEMGMDYTGWLYANLDVADSAVHTREYWDWYRRMWEQIDADLLQDISLRGGVPYYLSQPVADPLELYTCLHDHDMIEGEPDGVAYNATIQHWQHHYQR